MYWFYRFSLIVLAALLLTGCGQKSAGLQEGAVPPDRTLFENGMEFLDKNHFIKARLAFQTLINTYPDSEYTPGAFLAIADSYYEEGGSQNLLQSESQYKDFIIFYPTHDMADDAQMKIAAINVKLMKPYDRDPTYARKAETELKKFLSDFPDSELSPTALEALRDVQERLAMGDHMVGLFYMDRRNWTASQSRLKEVLEKYPTFSLTDETLFKLAQALEKGGQVEEATVYYARIASEFPFSPYFDDARNMLVLLEKDIPEVNTLLAARNEANRRHENFSIWDPVRSVWQVFAGGEDLYELARKRAEERKTGQPMNGAAPAAPPEENNN